MPWVGKNEKKREKGNFLPKMFGGFKYSPYLCTRNSEMHDCLLLQ